MSAAKKVLPALAMIAMIAAAFGFTVFFIPVTAGILNTGNAVGMTVCGVLFFMTVFRKRLFGFIFAHKPLRIAFWILAAAAAALAVLAAVISALMISAAGRPPDGDTTVVILGCRVRGEEPSLMLKQRVMTACGFLKDNPQVMCIVSGGQGDDELISEAECMKRLLTENGISADRIIMEDRSVNTEENILFSLEKMRENGLSGSVTIVTNEFHQLRAQMTAEKYTECYSVSAPTSLYLLPTYWVREWFGVCYRFVFG